MPSLPMKTDLLRLLLALSAAPLFAAVPAEPADPAAAPATTATDKAAPPPAERLSADTAIFSAPDAKAPVLTRLKAGAVITPATGPAPAGWRRVELSGPFEAYAHTRDITKGLEVRVGASLRAAPRADAPELGIATEGDKTDVIGLAGGDWCQIKLEKKLIGFIAVGETANLPATPPRPVPSTPTRPTGPAGPATPGQPAQFAGSTADLPRTFQGQLSAAARPIFNPNPPYDYQLVDANGRRVAYLDLRRVVLNARIESLVGRSVTLTGTLRNTVDGKDLVIAAETLQAK